MKQALGFLLILGLAGWAAAQDNGQGVLLPKIKQPLRGGMSLDEIRAALPDPDMVAWETLSNGTTFCYSDVGYPLLLQLQNGRLTDIRVEAVKANSKFGEWFDQQVGSLSVESLVHDTLSGRPGAKIPAEWWITPAVTWQRESTPLKKNRVNYAVLFPTNITTIPGGMLVRLDSLAVSLAIAFSEKKDLGYDTPPEPTNIPELRFPQPASQSHTSGEVQVQMYVDKAGTVTRWMIRNIDPVGLGFAREAERVVTRYEFHPAIRNGEPIAMWVTVPLNFEFKYYQADEIYLPRQTGR